MHKLILFAVGFNLILSCSVKKVKVFVPESSFKGRYYANSCSHYQNAYMERVVSSVKFYIGLTPIEELDNTVDLIIRVQSPFRFGFRGLIRLVLYVIDKNR